METYCNSQKREFAKVFVRVISQGRWRSVDGFLEEKMQGQGLRRDC